MQPRPTITSPQAHLLVFTPTIRFIFHWLYYTRPSTADTGSFTFMESTTIDSNSFYMGPTTPDLPLQTLARYGNYHYRLRVVTTTAYFGSLILWDLTLRTLACTFMGPTAANFVSFFYRTYRGIHNWRLVRRMANFFNAFFTHKKLFFALRFELADEESAKNWFSNSINSFAQCNPVKQCYRK
jgi:hypothetical protein